MSKKILAALLAVLMVLTIVPMTAFAAGFDDTTGHWGQSSIDRWAQLGILNGKGDGKFDPNGSMTRAEFAQMLVNMMGYTEKAENVFNDVPAGSWYEDAMLKLVAAGVLNGTGAGKADPNGRITREQTAVLLCRAFGIKPSPDATLTFKDSASVSDWARDAVAALAERGMMNGIGNNTAAPKLDINRASVAKLADNMIAHYVTADTTITGKVDGIVLVAGGATVTISDATVEAPVVVAPKAEEATVALAGETTVESVAVAAEGAAVTVADTATVGAVSVEAPSATAEIAGKVETVTVAEAAESAAVTVADTAEVGEVAVEAPSATAEIAGKVTAVTVAEAAESAAVTVAKTAEVGTVSVEAPKATTEIAGKADSVTVAGTAESAKVNVPGIVGTVKTEAANTDVKVDGKADSVTVAGENAKVDVAGTVGTVSTEAANTNVSVSGKVEKVDVAEGADKANISTTGTAKIDSVTTSAEDVKVSGTGSVGNVTANKGSADVTTPGTTVKNEGADNVTAGGKPVESGKEETTKPSTPSGGNSGGSTTPTPAPADVVAAPIVDQGKAPSQGAEKVVISNVGTVSVTGTLKSGTTDEYDVIITGQDIMNHTNAQSNDGHWVGFGMPAAPTGTAYKFLVGKGGETPSEVGSIASRTYTVGEKTYNTVYFSEDTEDAFNAATYKVVVQDNADSSVVATYNVTFDVTFWKANVTIADVNATTNATDYAQEFVQNAVKDIKVTTQPRDTEFIPVWMRANEKNPSELVEYTASKPDGSTKGYYSYYNMKIAPVEDVTLKLYNNGEGYDGGIEINAAMNLCQATKLFNADYTTEHPQHTYTVKDAAGRVQDTFKVDIHHQVRLTGAVTLTVNFKDAQGSSLGSTALNWVGEDSVAKSIAMFPVKTDESIYYTGKWKREGDASYSTAPTTIAKPAQSEEVTYVAESFKITDTELSVREKGPEGNHGPAVDNFDYQAAYAAAGISLEGSTVKVDRAKFLSFVQDALNNTDGTNATYLTHLFGNTVEEKTKQVFFGIAYGTPTNATKIAYATKLTDLSNATSYDLTGEHAIASAYNGNLISYIPVASVDKGVVTFLTQGDSDFCKWTDAEGNIVAVTKTKITVDSPALVATDGTAVPLMIDKATDNKPTTGEGEIDIRDYNSKKYITFEVEGLPITADKVFGIVKGGTNNYTVYTVSSETNTDVPTGPRTYLIAESSTNEGITDHNKGWTMALDNEQKLAKETWYFLTDKTNNTWVKVDFSYTPTTTDTPTE